MIAILIITVVAAIMIAADYYFEAAMIAVAQEIMPQIFHLLESFSCLDCYIEAGKNFSLAISILEIANLVVN